MTKRKSPVKIKTGCTMESYASQLVSEGKPFRIDFKTRSLTVNRIHFITEGTPSTDLKNEKESLNEVLEHIETLFSRYKRSIPSKKDTDHPSRYFQALREEDLTNEDMMYGVQRNTARFNLEFYVLKEIINGNLRWDSSFFGEKSWFWQSPKDGSLVLLKEWIQA